MKRFSCVFDPFRFCCFLGLVFATEIQAAPGDLDTSFAGSGKSRLGFGGGYDTGNAVAVQGDGKIIMAGSADPNYPGTGGADNFALVRFQTNGLLDTTFGNGGKVVTVVNTNVSDYAPAAAQAVQVQADGKIVVGGYAYNNATYPHSDFALARYNPDGSLDLTFGTNGLVYTDFGTGTVMRAMSLQFDGKIVAAGYAVYPGGNAGENGVVLARYDTNGTLDGSFGSGGKVITMGVVGYTGAHGLTIQPDGKIVAAGIGIGSGHGGIDFALYRFTTNGVLDPEFGGGSGKVFTAISTNVSSYNYFDSANGVGIQFGNNTLQNPDKLVAAGYYWNFNGNIVFAAARYLLDGTLDTTFGGNGIVTNSLTPSNESDFGQSVLVQGAGSFVTPRKITIAGYGNAGTNYFFLMVRYNADGSLDTSFGTNGTGRVTVSFGSYHDDEVNAIAFGSGNVLLAGSSTASGTDRDFAVARFTSSGALDPSYGSGGVATADVADRDSSGQAVTIQADGRIIVAGNANNGEDNLFALGRYNADGSLDDTFGTGGKVRMAVGTRGSGINAVATQTDGNIVAAGFSYNGTNNDFAVARYTTNGALDTSFGGTGIVSTPVNSDSEEASALTLQPDGKIILAGNTTVSGYSHFGLARYNTNGTLDTSFGTLGKVTTTVSSVGGDAALAVRLQRDGKIVAAGYAAVSASDVDFAVVRYNTNGARDFSFGNLGIVTTDMASGSVDEGLTEVIQPDGRIIVGGAIISGGNIFVALVRYATNGALDGTFGVNGKVITQIGAATDYPTSLALQPDGKIVAACVTKVGAYEQFAVLRFNQDGTPDNAYGTGGAVVANFAAGENDHPAALALDSLGRAVVVGNANARFGTMRFLGDPILKIVSINRLGDGHVILSGLGIPNLSHTLLSSPSLLPGSFGSLGSLTPDATGLWQYDDAGAVGVPRRFYRLSLP